MGLTRGGIIRKMTSVVNRKNYNLFIDSLRRDGLSMTYHKVVKAVKSPRSDSTPEYRKKIITFCKKYADEPAEMGKYSYPSSDEPLVSIIIPVYNNFKLTYDCIHSLIDSDLTVPTEVILADDCSTDETVRITEYLPGIRVVKTEGNLGFTLNCNNASKAARGKYIFFLNNDTLVLKNWLKPLVEVIESADDIGLVGSKLLYPDGTLQEAGGILWNDGSAWNYGNNQDPSLPEFNYVRETDYISGAAILVRTDLFRKLGGFDGRYAPAYCEDSDLAFEMRHIGYRVIYQPFSEIIHFEGMSNGKRVDSGLKQYQVINKEKFLDKWRSVLENEHYPNGEAVFKARGRTARRTTILFMEEMVPKFDDNAGHRTIYDYIVTLVKMGYDVKLFVNNFYRELRYTEIYQNLGVEVLYGVWYRDNWRNWLAENGKYIDVVMLYRPDIASVYLEPLKENTNAKIFYNIADLHYLRLQREYEITGDKRFKDESEEYKKMEYGFMRQSDVTVTVSDVERGIITSEDPSVRVEVFPIFCFDEQSFVRDRATEGHDILFVGGFSHRPNCDAMIWFVNDIFPKVLETIPDATMHIVGSNAPKDVLALGSDKVILHGHVSDSQLKELYRTCAVCVVPLRYGAGVKGKVVEAMHAGIPMVSTAIGLEGIPGIENVLTAHDLPEDFASEIIRLCTDKEGAVKISVSEGKFVDKIFSRTSMKNLFEKEFGPAMKSQ